MRNLIPLRVVDGAIVCDAPDSYVYELEVRGGRLFVSVLSDEHVDSHEDETTEYQDDIDLRELTEIFNNERY
jgi:hypothetical protein